MVARTKPASKTAKSPSRPASAATSPSRAEQVSTILATLHTLASPRVRDDMGKRYGITGPSAERALGVPMGAMFKLGKEYLKQNRGPDHALALALWEADGGRYECRIMACLVDDPAAVTSAQMDRWCRDFDNWGIVDTVCFKLFDRVDAALAFRKIEQWCASREEFTRRAGLALLACVALHNKAADHAHFADALPLIERIADDDRNFVKKSASWALRAIAGRTPDLHDSTLELAERLADSAHPGPRWIGNDVLRAIGNSKPRPRGARGNVAKSKTKPAPRGTPRKPSSRS